MCLLLRRYRTATVCEGEGLWAAPWQAAHSLGLTPRSEPCHGALTHARKRETSAEAHDTDLLKQECRRVDVDTHIRLRSLSRKYQVWGWDDPEREESGELERVTFTHSLWIWGRLPAWGRALGSGTGQTRALPSGGMRFSRKETPVTYLTWAECFRGGPSALLAGAPRAGPADDAGQRGKNWEDGFLGGEGSSWAGGKQSWLEQRAQRALGRLGRQAGPASTLTPAFVGCSESPHPSPDFALRVMDKHL